MLQKERLVSVGWLVGWLVNEKELKALTLNWNLRLSGTFSFVFLSSENSLIQ